MDFLHLFIIFAAGFIAGLMNAIAGGGTIITFPALILAGLPSIAANATSTVALIPSALGYTFGYRKNIPAVWNWIKLFAVVSLVGDFSAACCWCARRPPFSTGWCRFLILLATVIFMAQGYFKKLFRIERRADGLHRTRWIVGAVFFQFVVSVYGGYFGAGIGILMLATLGMLGVGDIHEMNTVKGILGFLINIVAAVYFAVVGLVHWEAAVVMTCGSVIGGIPGRITRSASRRKRCGG